MRDFWNGIVRIVSGEWMLDGHPNGGDIILARAILASTILYIGFIAIKHVCDPSRGWSFSRMQLQEELRSSIVVYGTFLAAIYASLYARFSSQWNYLASLYNKLLEVECKLTGEETPDQKRALAFWKASFVEDAEDLHLSTKRMFVPAIREWLEEPDVRAAFVEGAIGGQSRLDRLEKRLVEVTG